MKKASQEKVSLTIDVDPQVAWDVIGAVGGVVKWFAPLIQSCRVEGNKSIALRKPACWTRTFSK